MTSRWEHEVRIIKSITVSYVRDNLIIKFFNTESNENLGSNNPSLSFILYIIYDFKKTLLKLFQFLCNMILEVKISRFKEII